MELPRPQGARHQPLAHYRAYDAVRHEIDRAGLEHESTRFNIQHAPHGVKPVDKCIIEMRLKPDEGSDQSRMIGLRNSNDQTWSLQGIAGINIMACSNGIFEGEFSPLTRKHTTNIHNDLWEAVREGFGKLMEQWVEVENFLKKIKACYPMGPYDVPSALYNINQRMEKKVLPLDKFPELVNLTISPPQDWEPCSLWAMHNAYTELLKSDRSPEKPLRARYLNSAFNAHIEEFHNEYLGYSYELS